MKTFRPFIGLILTIAALSSCGLFPPVRTGSIAIQFDFPDDPPVQERGFVLAAADALGFDLNEAKAFDPSTILIRLTVDRGNMGDIVEERAYNNEAGPFLLKADGIPEGTQHIIVEGLWYDDVLLTRGETTVFVAAGRNTTAVVNMVPVGAIQLWPWEGTAGLVNAGMKAFHYFVVEYPTTYRIYLYFGETLSSLFTLYDSNGVRIILPPASLDVESPDYGLTRELQPGTYYLSVTSPLPLEDGGETSYSLNIIDSEMVP